MQISDAGLALIAEFEGFSGHLYNDPSGNCTIGYGNLLHMGKCDGRAEEQPYKAGITEEQGRAMLAQKVLAYADCVAKAAFATLTQPQFDALVSFAYNVGQGSYINSPVRAAVNSGGDVCAALMLYVHGSDGLALPGLRRRREAECAMYHSTAAPEEEEDMKPFLVWDLDRARSYLIGPGGAAWITLAADVAALEAVFGKTAVTLHASSIDAIGAAR